MTIGYIKIKTRLNAGKYTYLIFLHFAGLSLVLIFYVANSYVLRVKCSTCSFYITLFIVFLFIFFFVHDQKSNDILVTRIQFGLICKPSKQYYRQVFFSFQFFVDFPAFLLKSIILFGFRAHFEYLKNNS